MVAGAIRHHDQLQNLSELSAPHVPAPSPRRPSEPYKKTLDAVQAFRAAVTNLVQAAIPATNTLPVQVHVQDESRWGLMTLQRRRITVRGVKPGGLTQHDYANRWVSGTVAPHTGTSFFLILPPLNAAHMHMFLNEFARAHATTFNILILDNSAAHTPKKVRRPAKVAFVFLPPSSPELNPIERVWEDVRGRMAWQHFQDGDDLEAALAEHLTTYAPTTLQSLTNYPYLQPVFHAVCP